MLPTGIETGQKISGSLSLLLVKTGPDLERAKDKGPFLVELAKLLRKSTREEDIIGRENGGFGILLYKTGRQGSRLLKKGLPV